MYKKKFELGQVVMTRGIASFIEERNVDMNELINIVKLHQEGDWGNVCEDDWKANDDALESGARILSSYNVRGKKVWIITEAEGLNGKREATTILFPEEY